MLIVSAFLGGYIIVSGARRAPGFEDLQDLNRCLVLWLHLWEIISGVPLFRGRDNQDLLMHIMCFVGTPDDCMLRMIATESVCAQLAHNAH